MISPQKYEQNHYLRKQRAFYFILWIIRIITRDDWQVRIIEYKNLFSVYFWILEYVFILLLAESSILIIFLRIPFVNISNAHDDKGWRIFYRIENKIKLISDSYT